MPAAEEKKDFAIEGFLGPPHSDESLSFARQRRFSDFTPSGSPGRGGDGRGSRAGRKIGSSSSPLRRSQSPHSDYLREPPRTCAPGRNYAEKVVGRARVAHTTSAGLRELIFYTTSASLLGNELQEETMQRKILKFFTGKTRRKITLFLVMK